MLLLNTGDNILHLLEFLCLNFDNNVVLNKTKLKKKKKKKKKKKRKSRISEIKQIFKTWLSSLYILE